MESDVEVPRGLIRTWKMWAALAVVAMIAFLIGTASGHSYARVETKEVRIEVPPKACRDGVIFMSEVNAAACEYPEQVGALIERNGHTWYECTCPRSQLEAGAR